MSSTFIHTISYPGRYHDPPIVPLNYTKVSSGRTFSAHSGTSSGHGDCDGGDGDSEPIKMDFYPSDSYSCGGDSDFYRINGDFYGDISGTFDESLASVFGSTDKQTMKDLNGRLAKYLEKVRSLRESNSELERKIHEWYENKQALTATSTQRDYSNYYTTIGELRAKIFQCTTENSKVILKVDNARLTAEDFKLKYENELGMRRSVAADISGLRRLLDQLTVSKSDLEIQVESLNEELAYHKKNHEEEIGEMGTKATNQISVEIDAAPGNDLTNILAEMRGKYETMADKNRREAEAKFIATREKLQKDILANVEQVQTGKSEIIELRRTLQGLEIDLQTQLSLKARLEASLSESECNYGAQLFQIQSTISRQEAQLTDIRSDMARQNHEYKTLLHVKNRLQMEINKYQQLIEGQDAK